MCTHIKQNLTQSYIQNNTVAKIKNCFSYKKYKRLLKVIHDCYTCRDNLYNDNVCK